ncbi:MAG: DegT/DnrJ/EryC1/StrS aminotransferase family protein [Candidatus Omnitrophica bacterium]|nr:DegT/DnrJ/EryC1/StrS aminotransferase family protein [Candidatus Omnitrophota bacterium]
MIENKLPAYKKEKCTFFALGRNAMYAACNALGLKKGDEILTPAFDCDGSLQPFRVLEYKPIFFRSDPRTFSADLEDIKKKITPKTKLLHIINHFGMPQPWNDILSLQREVNIPIMEDNAYSLFSSLDGKPFGTFGDAAIFSLRKNLPLADGGMLRINNPRYKFTEDSKKSKFIYKEDLESLAVVIKNRVGLSTVFRSLRQGPPPPLYSNGNLEYPVWAGRDHIGKEFSCNYTRSMSRFSRQALDTFLHNDYEAMIEKKRKFYSILSKGLKGIRGIEVLWPELPEGIVPFSLSFLVSNHRDAFFDFLRKKYDVMAWPTLSALVLEQLKDFPDVELLGRRLLQLNLPSDKVKKTNFPQYIENVVEDIHKLAQKYI